MACPYGVLTVQRRAPKRKTTIYGDEIQNVLQIIQSGQFAQGEGQVTQQDVVHAITAGEMKHVPGMDEGVAS